MPRAPLALRAITGQKDSVQAWRDQTSAAASGPKSCPPLAAPHRALQRTTVARGRTASGGCAMGPPAAANVSLRHARTEYFWPVIAGTADGAQRVPTARRPRVALSDSAKPNHPVAADLARELAGVPERVQVRDRLADRERHLVEVERPGEE